MVRVVLTVTMCLTLAGCGGFGSSSLNPANWFRSGEPEAEGLMPAASARRDTRPIADSITDIAVDPVPGGVILRARALVPGVDWYGGDLAPDAARSGGGTLAFTFRARRPDVPSSTSGSRRLLAGVYLSDDDLLGVTRLAVYGRANALTARP